MNQFDQYSRTFDGRRKNTSASNSANYLMNTPKIVNAMNGTIKKVVPNPKYMSYDNTNQFYSDYF